MIVTTYTCDNCKHSQESAVGMWEMGITVYSATYFSDYKSPIRKALWCRKCVEELGLLPQQVAKEVPKEPLKFEDLIREIVRGELENIHDYNNRNI